MNVTYAWAAEIVKSERDDNGDLIVYGKATGPDLDLDGQICDPGWLKSAMPAWMEWGNLREMHQPIAAGVGMELDGIGDDWWLKSKAIDPGTAAKIEAGVLKGYSIGIKHPKVIKDAAAPGGRIVGGSIVEVSYVDRPCNPTAKMTICKSISGAGSGDLRPVEAPEIPAAGDGESSAADDAGTGQADSSSGDGVRDPGGSQDTASGTGVEHPSGVREYDKAVGRDVLRRVRKALGADVLTKAAPAEDIASARACQAAIGRLIEQEAAGLAAGNVAEAGQIRILLGAVEALEWFIECESYEPVDEAAEMAADDLAGAVKDAPDMALDAADDTDISMGATADLTKTKTSSALTLTLDRSTVTDMIKAAVTEANKAAEERITALAAELAKVKASPIPGGPVLARPQQTIAKAEERTTALAQADHWDRLALEFAGHDEQAASGYRKLAATARATAAA